MRSDRFQQAVTLGLNEEGEKSVPSSFGACLSILIFSIVLAYSGYQLVRVVFKRHYNLLQTVVHDSYTSFDEFTAEQGFMFSFALDSQYGPLEIPPEVGTLSIVSWDWGYNEDGVYQSGFTEIKTHACSNYELGLTTFGEGV